MILSYLKVSPNWTTLTYVRYLDTKLLLIWNFSASSKSWFHDQTSFADRVFQTEIRVIQSRQNCPLKKRHLVLKCSMIINHWLKFKTFSPFFLFTFLLYRNILLSVTQPSIWSKELSLKQSSLQIRTTNAISLMYLGCTA